MLKSRIFFAVAVLAGLAPVCLLPTASGQQKGGGKQKGGDKGPPAPMPVFGTPREPSSKIQTPAQLRAMDTDLDSASKRHDVLRAGFAPSAKAMAEAKAEAAEKAKRKKKPTEAASKPSP